MKNGKINPRVIGLLLLILVIAGTGIYYVVDSRKVETTVLDGYLGGEKIGFFEDPEVQKLLEKNYHIAFDYSKAGSLDMVQADQTGKDYLFPSSQTALEYYKDVKGAPRKDEIILNTPIVLYTHQIVLDAFINKGLVTEENGIYYVDMEKMTQVIADDVSWSELGIPQLYGNVSIDTTDPVKSNSGNMFAGLLANVLNGGKTADEQSVKAILPKLKEIFSRLGYMESSSSDLFSQFLKMGVGAKPVIAGYESQLLEFSVENPADFAKVKDDIVMMYPAPTVWSTHIYIALTENGVKGIDGLLDSEVQKLAWKNHGFRTSLYSAGETDAGFDVKGLAPQITQVMSMPDYKTMKLIMEELK